MLIWNARLEWIQGSATLHSTRLAFPALVIDSWGDSETERLGWEYCQHCLQAPALPPDKQLLLTSQEN